MLRRRFGFGPAIASRARSPWPCSPIRWSSGISASWKEIDAVSDARCPIRSACPSTVTPASRGTTNAEIPRVPARSSVLANTVYQSAWLALVMKHLRPWMTQPSSLAAGGGRDRGGVGTGVGLGQAERRQPGCLREPSQIDVLQALAAAEQQRHHPQPVRGQRGGDAGASPAELLGDHARVVEAPAGPAVGGRQHGVHQPELPRSVDELLWPGGVGVVFPGDRADLVLCELVGGRGDAACRGAHRTSARATGSLCASPSAACACSSLSVSRIAVSSGHGSLSCLRSATIPNPS